jgi:ketosteroid isomerase-like protein
MHSSPQSWLARRAIRRLFFLTAFAGASSLWTGASAKTPVATTVEVEAATQQFVQAWEKEDVDAALATFLPDAIAIDPDPPGIFENTEGIRGWLAGTFQSVKKISIKLSAVRVHTSGPTAWLTSHYVFKGEADRQPVGDEGNVSIVWVKQDDGSYKISVFHASVPPPPPKP